jgi:hypothetical protein
MYDLYKLTGNKECILKLTIYDAIKFVSKSWENVKCETIVHSWEKVGILPKDDLDNYINYENSEDNVELELQNIMNEYYEETITTEDYINCDSTYEIEAMPKLEEIIAVVLNKEEEEEEEENIIHINTNDALKSCINLLTYIQQEQVPKFIVEDRLLDSLQELKKKIISQSFREAKQVNLDFYKDYL